jgi:hypothetical protein
MPVVFVAVTWVMKDSDLEFRYYLPPGSTWR